MTSSAICFDRVVKKFENHTVFDHLSLSIPSGQSWVIIGPSGEGKSVFLKCLLGLLPIEGGNILMDGKSIIQESEKEQETRLSRIGMVFQSSALFDSLTIWENIVFGLQNTQQLSPQQEKEKAIASLEQVELDPEVADQYPAELSGGMQRRVALARAIILKPSFLFCDEPTSGLDPILTGLISHSIRKSITSLNATAITITHDIKSAQIIGDFCAMLYQGKIIWYGPISELTTTSHSIVHRFVQGIPLEDKQ